MEKSQKVIGAYTMLDTSKHLNVKQVAGKWGLDPVLIWKAMRLGRLKYEMAMTPGLKRHPKASGFARVTTKEWVEEWRSTLNDKNYQTYNGKPMYNREAGEMSSSEVQKYLGGWTKNRFMYFVYRQEIKFTKKGYYYIFYKEDVEAFKRMIEERYGVEEAQEKLG